MSKLSSPMHLSNDYPKGFICNATKEHGEIILYEDHAEKETEIIPCSCVKCLAKENKFEIKEPVATQRYNVEELIAMDLVGLYELE